MEEYEKKYNEYLGVFAGACAAIGPFLGPLVIPVAGGVLEGIIEANGMPSNGLVDVALAYGPSAFFGATFGGFMALVTHAAHNDSHTVTKYGLVAAGVGFGLGQGIRFAAKYATMGIYKAIGGN